MWPSLTALFKSAPGLAAFIVFLYSLSLTQVTYLCCLLLVPPARKQVL